LQKTREVWVGYNHKSKRRLVETNNSKIVRIYSVVKTKIHT